MYWKRLRRQQRNFAAQKFILLTMGGIDDNIREDMRERFILFACLVAFMAIDIDAAPDMSDFARYQVILQRRPFGAPPVVSTIAPPPPPVNLVYPFKDYRLVAITRGDSGEISVGIVDISAQPVQSIFLSPGQSDFGLTLVDADFELEGALIRKGIDEKWLYLGGSALGGGPTSTGSAPESSVGASRDTKGVPSYIERMRARRAAVRTTVVEPPRLSGDELNKHLQEYNMELIRKSANGEGGAPPLPIQLTPEQDKQLVAEGILPAQ